MSEIASIQKTFHKAIFDCFNEVLSSYWSRDLPLDFVSLLGANKQIQPRQLASRDELERVLYFSKEVVLEFASLQCGVIKDKEDSMTAHLKGMDAGLVSMIREERLIKMLAIDVVAGEQVFEQEKHWVNYTREDAMNMIDCADSIYEQLIEEAALDLLRIASCK